MHETPDYTGAPIEELVRVALHRVEVRAHRGVLLGNRRIRQAYSGP